MLRDRAKHTYTHACTQDNNLAILHPGIEEWFAEGNGNVFEWRKKWSAIADEHGNLQLPTSLNTATIGNSGSRGITLARPKVCARPTLLATTIKKRCTSGRPPSDCLALFAPPDGELGRRSSYGWTPGDLFRR